MKMQTEVVARSASDDALSFAAERARRYVQEIVERRVAPEASAVAALATFHEKFPETGSDPREVIRKLDEFGSPATVATTGGRYFGFVTGGASPASLAASWLASAWDQNAGLRVMSPVGVELEDIALAGSARRCTCRRTAKAGW